MGIAGYRVLNIHVAEPLLEQVHEQKKARRLTLDEYVTEALTEKMARDASVDSGSLGTTPSPAPRPASRAP